MRSIQLPTTIEEAIGRLDGLERLAWAKDWERAAIVYCLTRDGEAGDHWARKRQEGVAGNFPLYSCYQFAGLGIYGLTDPHSVRAHRDNWKFAIKQGWAVHVERGDDVVLPDEKYPPTGNDRGLADAFKQDASVEKRIEGARKLIDENPEVAKRIEQDFVQKAAEDPALAMRVQMAAEEFRPEPMPRPQPVGLLDFADLTGVGAEVYTAVKVRESKVVRLADHLRDDDEPRVSPAVLDSVIGSLEKTRRLIERYEDDLRAAAGRNYDETFRRLVEQA